MCTGELSPFGVVRLWPTFVMRERTRQERLVYEVLKDLNANVVPLEESATADPATFALFVNKKPLRKPLHVGFRSVNFFLITTHSCEEHNIVVPEWAAGARGCIALDRHYESDFRASDYRARLTDAMREACRIWTRRLRQEHMKTQLEAKRAARALAVVSGQTRHISDFH